VALTNGAELRAVELVPALLPRNPSELDWRIVHHTVAIIGAEERCYRSLGKGLRRPLRDMVPDARFLDCQQLSGLDLPPLKVLALDIAARDPTLKRLSQQKIADALRKFGIRIPRPRPRRNGLPHLP